MKSLARKISQTFVKNDTNGIIESKNSGLKKKKSIKDMMVDTFKNPFSYLKNGTMNNDVLSRNKNISDVKYSTFSSTEYESVFNHSVDPTTFSKSDPSKLIYVPKNLINEDIKDLQSSICESNEPIINNVNDSNTVNSQVFNNISVQAASLEQRTEDEENEERQSSESTLYSEEKFNRTDSGYEDKSKSNQQDNKRSFLPWNFIKSKISFSKSEVSNFCNDHKLTSYERYENYSSDNETADISEDETAIELQVININQKPINEGNMVPEPENDEIKEFSI